jgi:hypothetical protein
MAEKKRKKRKIQTYVIPADDFIVEAEDGTEFAPHKGETVTLRRDMSWSAFRITGELAMREYAPRAIDLLNQQIVAWTLTDPDSGDEDGNREPYPQPGTDEFEPFLWEMDNALRWWLLGKVFDRSALPN